MSSQTLSNVELVFWNLGGDQARSVATARHALSVNGLNVDRAEYVPDSTAFRRAVKHFADGKETLVRFWTRKTDSVLCAQIDRENENGDGKLHREYRGRAELHSEGVIDYVGDGNGLALSTQFEEAKRNYTGADISKVLMDVITKDGLGAYSPRKNGGVYFVPVRPDAQDLLDRIGNFCNAMGVRFLRYQIPDTGEQRAEVAQAVADSLGMDLEAHAAAIAAYTPDTKLGHLDNRAEAIAYTASMVTKLWHLIPSQATDLNARIAKLREDLGKARATIEAQLAAKAPARRRIVGVNT